MVRYSSLSIDIVSNLMEDNRGELMSSGPKSWPYDLQLSQCASDTFSVAPPPTNKVGSCPLYSLHLFDHSVRISVQNRCYMCYDTEWLE